MNRKTIEIPWFPKELSANSRKQHRYIGKIKKKYKEQCWFLAKGKSLKGNTLTIWFHPPDNRRRDLDNMLAGIKYGIDAICSCLKIDDSQFTKKLIIKSYPVKGGKIIIKEGLHLDET